MPFESDTVAILALPLADFDALRNQLSNRRIHVFLIILIILSSFQFALTASSSLLVDHLPLPFQMSISAFVSALHLILSLLHSLFAYYLHQSYFWKLRLIGFHLHYEKTVGLLQFVDKINQYCSGSLLAVWTIFSTIAYKSQWIHSGDQLESIQSDLSIGIVCICLCAVFFYLGRLFLIEIKFKATRNLPDVYEIENPDIPGRNVSEVDIGIQQTSYVEDLLLRQAELIDNLKLQNWHLRDTLSKVNRDNDLTANC